MHEVYKYVGESEILKATKISSRIPTSYNGNLFQKDMAPRYLQKLKIISLKIHAHKINIKRKKKRNPNVFLQACDIDPSSRRVKHGDAVLFTISIRLVGVPTPLVTYLLAGTTVFPNTCKYFNWHYNRFGIYI